MGIIISTIGVDSGLQWEQNLNASEYIIDAHDHTPGKGVQITPAGFDINSDLLFNGYNATVLRAVRFSVQASPIANTGSDVGEIYVSGNELYYNDVTGGNQVKITTNGSVNAGAGSISGLPSGTASASYSAGTFTWQSATNTAANMDFQSAVLRNSGASAHGLTLSAPSLSANTAQTLPATPVSATSIMQMDTSGNMSAILTADNSTIQVSSNQLKVKAGGITTSQIASSTITKGNLNLTSVIPTFQSQTFTSNSTFTVPAGVTRLEVYGRGGAGGGGGAGGAAGGTGSGGGGGGVASYPELATLGVSPGDVLTVTVGAGGAGGVGGETGFDGAAGSRGSNTIVGALTFRGAKGGGGGASNAGGGGGSTPDTFYGNKGGGGGASGGFNGDGGQDSIWNSGGAGGSGSGTGGGGGGGGASDGAGGAGAAASNVSINNGTAGAANSGAGGGGGGGRGGATGKGGDGGNGGSGGAIVLWVQFT